ncbi:MAG: malic enzyme-like NAD(P)-binding protein [Steroidobacteraceae bacterium]
MKIPEILMVETVHQPGSLARVLQVIAEAGLIIDHLNAVRRERGRTLWEITLEMDEATDRSLYQRIDDLPNARFMGKSDRVFERHRGGKLRFSASMAINTQQVLRDIYTPGVARVCLAIRDDPSLAREYTSLDRTVAVVTNGTAVLGLGNIGALAGLPVMEGKAALFAALAGLNAVPILLEETDPARCVEVICSIAASFGAIQLEDIAAPACFDIEAALRERLDKPVLHDDQHGTAVVVLAALMNATARVGRDLSACSIGQVGLGAAGIGIARLLGRAGVTHLRGSDLNPLAVQRFESMGGRGGSLQELMQECDVIVATTGVRALIDPRWVRPGQVILALSNPDAEIDPVQALEAGAAFAADGKGINNVLGFPGLFKGALQARAAKFTDAMLLAAAHSIAAQATPGELVPDPLDPRVHAAVAEAVRLAALADED